MRLAGLALALTLVSSPASAAVIGFGNWMYGELAYGHPGFTIEAVDFRPTPGSIFGIPAPDDPARPAPKDPVVQVVSGELRIARSNPGALIRRVVGIDLADFDNLGNTANVTFAFNLAAGGSVVQQVQLDALPGLEHVAFGFFGPLSSLTISGPVQIDNFHYHPMGNGVPEPATWALMIGGFGLAGASLRRRPATA